ncbi:MAG: hypothetical protein H0V22_11125 [Solirubrobacterales bacterium]|jgi:hypothetical protein|nr:hypothetical protein [Solirubrobacterales bacterium]
MTGVEVLLAIAGLVAFVLVIAAMILMTPYGQVEVHSEEADAQGSNLSPAPVSDRPLASTRA